MKVSDHAVCAQALSLLKHSGPFRSNPSNCARKQHNAPSALDKPEGDKQKNQTANMEIGYSRDSGILA